MFWNGFNRQSLAMSMRWYIWSSGFWRNMTRKSFWDRLSIARAWQGLYSFGATLGRKKQNLYQNFKSYNAKGFVSLSRPPSPLGFVPWIFLPSVLWWRGRLFILLPLFIVPLPLLLVLLTHAPCRTYISTSEWTGSTASGSYTGGSSASASILLINAALRALTLTLKSLHFDMQNLINNENLDSNENNINTNRNSIPTKPTHQ